MSESAAERYLRLGLRLGRHVEGIVDAYFGPPELAAAVDAEPLVQPGALVAAAEALLEELDDGWLRDQVTGLRTYASALAGEQMSYVDEVEGCYGVRPTYTDETVFEAAHEQLEDLLPGEGRLADRYRRWEDSIRVPADRIESTLAAVIGEARAATRRLVELPGGEAVVLEIVRDEPWLGFCEYLGDARSRISVNVTLPMSVLELLVLAMHETYPGHHTERCCKERILVGRGGMLEETLVLVPTPQSLVSEGIASLAPDMVFECGADGMVAVVRDAGIRADLGHTLAVRQTLEPCRWAEVNAALLLHECGASRTDVRVYLERWGLMAPDLAAHVVRFLEEPTSRTYITTYAAGRDLCRSYVANEPARFGRLLTEQVRVRELLSAPDEAVPSASGTS